MKLHQQQQTVFVEWIAVPLDLKKEIIVEKGTKHKTLFDWMKGGKKHVFYPDIYRYRSQYTDNHHSQDILLHTQYIFASLFMKFQKVIY